MKKTNDDLMQAFLARGGVIIQLPRGMASPPDERGSAAWGAFGGYAVPKLSTKRAKAYMKHLVSSADSDGDAT